MSDDRKAFTDSLRALADWFDAHKEVAVPDEYFREMSFYPEDTRENAAAIMLALKPCTKEYADTLFVLHRAFGSLKTKWYFQRNSVCVRKVVGTKEVPEQHIAERPAQVIPAHVEEIVEGECEPVLTHKAA